MSNVFLVLTGKWQFKQYPAHARRMRDLDEQDWLTTQRPCSIFNSLIEAGQINEADLYANPENYTWVSKKPWVYSKTFDANAELLRSDRTDLIFEGLDTIASVWLNEKLIAKTNDMFIPYRFDVTKLLKPTNNRLLVKFEPAEAAGRKLMERYGSFSELDFINPCRVYVRKAQHQFGWDFCPALPGCGIWRTARLEGIRKARLADIHIRTIEANSEYADVKITVKLDIAAKKNFLCKLAVSGHCTDVTQDLNFERSGNIQSAVIRIQNPALWWPKHYGRQNLYQLGAELFCDDEPIDTAAKKFGIRTVKLNRSPDKHGENFQFEINGRAVYAGGANWIPVSIFAGQVKKTDYEKLLQMVVDANINIIRVWGGGYYEKDEFYELCDKLGIMVWQDFPFTCAYYPDRQWFLDKIKTEAAAAIKKLRNYACLVLWCGNNEIDWMHYAAALGKGKKFYGKAIYHKLLPKLLAELDPDRDYIPSTPLGPEKNENDPNSGTVHRWDVWSLYAPVRDYLQPAHKLPRFVAEFGFASLPNTHTIKSFCPAEQLHLGSGIIEKHNYQLDGISRLYRYLADLFGTAKDLEEFVYLSQLTQARACKTFVEYLRAHPQRNHGVLFWQFNDCFPAISWSATDYLKRPKALYYYARRFFAPLLVTAVPQYTQQKLLTPAGLTSLNAIVINNTANPLTAALSCTLMDLLGNIIDQVRLPVSIGPFASSVSFKLPGEMTHPDSPNHCCLRLVVEKHGRKIAENLFFYAPDKYINWPVPRIDEQLAPINQRQWKLRLTSNVLAKDVQISTSPPAKLSDNFFDLMPKAAYEVTIDTEETNSDSGALAPAIQLRTLNCPDDSSS